MFKRRCTNDNISNIGNECTGITTFSLRTLIYDIQEATIHINVTRY